MRKRGPSGAFIRVTVIAVIVLSVSSCGEDTPPIGPAGEWTPSPGVPTRAVLTCRADGSMGLTTEIVQPQPDGVHLIVENRFDEPVSVAGFDADSGTTRWVFSSGPGAMSLMCWPFSMHTSGDDPDRHDLTVVDPSGLDVDGSVACEFESVTIGTPGEPTVDDGPPPMDVVRDIVSGLRADDVLRVEGYPEQDGGSVLVVRDGVVVASYTIGRYEGEPWSILGASVCEGTGLSHEGQSFH